MGRPKRAAQGGLLFHAWNQAVSNSALFATENDYCLFEEILNTANERFDMRLCAYCLLPSHWHLLLWPEKDRQLSQYLRWVSLTHTRRTNVNHGAGSKGSIYRARFRSFIVQHGSYAMHTRRYIEQNPVRLKLVTSALDWRHSSLWQLANPNQATVKIHLDAFPIEQLLIEAQHPLEDGVLKEARNCKQRGAPFGDSKWVAQIAKELGLETTLRARGRPKKPPR